MDAISCSIMRPVAAGKTVVQKQPVRDNPVSIAAAAVVEDLDVLGDLMPGLLAGLVAAMMN